jgi:phage N-6-adenine-methyltransferase
MSQQSLFASPQINLTSDDYYTPPELFDKLGIEFDLDVASPPHKTCVPCKRYYTQADNGLLQPWYGIVWMNPPFSEPRPWVEKFMQHNNGLGIVPTSNGKWLTELWNSDICITLPTPIKFIKGDTKMAASIPTRCYLIATKQHKKALQRFGKVR